MERLFTFWRRYADLSKESRGYIAAHARVVSKTRRSRYTKKSMFCFVLHGLAGLYETLDDGRQNLAHVLETNDYFTTTKHIHSNKPSDLVLRFLEDSVIAEIPIATMRRAQQSWQDVAELMNALKEKRMKRTGKLLRILKIGNSLLRYKAFGQGFGHLLGRLDESTICDFINLSIEAYRRAEALVGEEAGQPPELLGPICAYIGEEIGKGNVPTPEGLCGIFHIKLRTLHKAFAATFHLPPGKYIAQQRLAVAFDLLVHRGWGVQQVAYHLGYNHLYSFERAFWKRYGVLPRDAKTIFGSGANPDGQS